MSIVFTKKALTAIRTVQRGGYTRPNKTQNAKRMYFAYIRPLILCVGNAYMHSALPKAMSVYVADTHLKSLPYGCVDVAGNGLPRAAALAMTCAVRKNSEFSTLNSLFAFLPFRLWDGPCRHKKSGEKERKHRRKVYP